MQKHLLFVLLFLGVFSVLKSQEITFKAQADKTEVSVNERFAVQFILTYSQEIITVDKAMSLPDFGGLHQLGESNINSFQFSNGVAINQSGFEAILIADREGTYTIGSAVIKLNGKEYKTKPIKITVKKGLKPKEPAGQRIQEAFISAEITDENPFINQEVILVVKIYTRNYAILQRLRNYKEPDFNDMIAKYISEKPENDEKQVLINGQTYFSKELARYVLFPQKTGEIEIDPFSVSILVSSFYGSENIPLSTEPIVMNVKNLPTANRPSDFSGAIGNFDINTNLSKNSVKANETVSLEVEIIGSGNLNTLKMPKVEVSENIETFNPKKRDAYEARPGGIKGKIVETHLLVPQYGGDYTIGPVKFNYFDPEKNKYVSIHSEEFKLKVDGPLPEKKKDEEEVTDIIQQDKANADTRNTSIIPEKINEVGERVTRTVENKNGWIWIISVAGLALLALVFVRKKGKSENVFGEFSSKTDDMLKDLKKLSGGSDKNEFLDLQEKILTQIGMFYSHTSLSDFTENEVADKLKPKYGELSDKWKSLLLECKQSKYRLDNYTSGFIEKYEQTAELWKSFKKYTR